MYNCYLYCITDQPDNPAIAAGGIAGHKVETFSYKGYHALYSILEEGGRPDMGLLNLKIHNRISLAAMNGGTVLPFRYGTVVKSRESIGELLNGMSGWLGQQFTRFRGKIETGVKVFGNISLPEAGNAESVPEPGRFKSIRNDSEAGRYMINMIKNAYNARMRDEFASRLAEAIFVPFNPLLYDKRIIHGKKDGLLLNGAFLVGKEHFEAFKNIYLSIKEQYPEYSFVFSGPWPPYSFLDIGKEGEKSG
jgi:hypothetical protein